MEITSTANPKIKKISKMIKDSSLRNGEGLIVVDGKREIEEALNSSWDILEFFYCLDFIKNEEDVFLKKIKIKAKSSYVLDKKVFEKISYKKNPDGFLAIISFKKNNLDDFKLKKNSLILVLESVEKPGNLGAIIRTAYASGVDLIILNDQKTDFYSPNVIRASTGFIFSMPVVIDSIDNTISWLNKNNINIFLTTIDSSSNHFSADLKKSSAIIFGTEAFGLSEKWLSTKSKKIKIPMIKGVDSLNVSVSVGIIVYEAIRQRSL